MACHVNIFTENQPHEQKRLEVIFYFSLLRLIPSTSFWQPYSIDYFTMNLRRILARKASNLFLVPIFKGIILSLSTCDICWDIFCFHIDILFRLSKSCSDTFYYRYLCFNYCCRISWDSLSTSGEIFMVLPLVWFWGHCCCFFVFGPGNLTSIFLFAR